MKITKTNKTLSKREMSKLIKNKNTINLSSIERRKNTRYEKKIKALKFKGLIVLIILTFLLGLFQYKVYGDIKPIQTTKIEVKQELDPLQSLLIDNPEIEEIIKDSEAPILGTKELLKKNSFNINKLAYAVAYHETKNCTLGYGKEYNNCFGIKQNRTARCDKVGRNRMCIFKKPEDSYVAFKIIWSKWYGELPNIEKAKRWSGNDRAKDWLNNVLHIYNKDLG